MQLVTSNREREREKEGEREKERERQRERDFRKKNKKNLPAFRTSDGVYVITAMNEV